MILTDMLDKLTSGLLGGVLIFILVTFTTMFASRVGRYVTLILNLGISVKGDAYL